MSQLVILRGGRSDGHVIGFENAEAWGDAINIPSPCRCYKTWVGSREWTPWDCTCPKAETYERTFPREYEVVLTERVVLEQWHSFGNAAPYGMGLPVAPALVYRLRYDDPL